MRWRDLGNYLGTLIVGPVLTGELEAVQFAVEVSVVAEDEKPILLVESHIDQAAAVG